MKHFFRTSFLCAAICLSACRVAVAVTAVQSGPWDVGATWDAPPTSNDSIYIAGNYSIFITNGVDAEGNRMFVGDGDTFHISGGLVECSDLTVTPAEGDGYYDKIGLFAHR